ncbi:hypothetical protein CYMTET_7123 [Cymbomonas tetramitiformis]|uniref:protein-serine/threonine phosphatase n=1 Tax=Cymbomonas tetramitiformis TaxID=36881 RepID=A0AAE0LHR9_9CHLO|nr:hypothetical protein CYMTET_7123 [Cymbomonas tetramitiformis]
MGCAQSSAPAGSGQVPTEPQNPLLENDENLKHMNLKRRQTQKTTELQLGAKLKLKYAYICQQGHYPDKPNYVCQDQCTVIDRFEDLEDQAFMGVFDGHGQVGAGDLISKLAKEKIPHFFRILRSSQKYQHFGNSAHPKPDLKKSAYSAAFIKANKSIISEVKEKSNMSGSTAVTAFFCEDAVHVANVGDSRAILLRSYGSECTIVELSKDQTPFREDERQRILKSHKNADIMTMGMKYGDVPVSEDYGDEEDLFGAGADPPRIWMKGEKYPGCAFTRSIGDSIGKTVGIFAEPEIYSRKLRKEDKYLVIASDGIFEFLSNDDVMQVVLQHDDPYEACEELVKTAFSTWLQYDERADDITVIVVHIEMVDDGQKSLWDSASEKAMETVLKKQLRKSSKASRLHAVVKHAQRRFGDKENAVLSIFPNQELEKKILPNKVELNYELEEE